VTVAMLSRCQSPVNCRGRNVEDSTKHTNRYCRNFQTLQFIPLSENAEDLSSQGRKGGWILKIAELSEDYIGNDDWQFVIYVEEALTCVVLSKAEKHLPYGEPLGIAECVSYRRGVASHTLKL
jgi:hypothetical protein